MSGFIVPIALLLIGFWFWMLIHAATRDFAKDVDKLVWVMIILLLPIIGAFMYYCFAIPKRSEYHLPGDGYHRRRTRG